MRKEYKNSQNNIAFKFNYETDEELKNNFEGMVFDLLEFISENNLEEELVEYLEHPEYDLGTNFKAICTDTFDEWLDKWEM